MLTTNPFAAVAASLSPLAMQAYVALMVLAVIVGTLFDVAHKGSGRYYEERRTKARRFAERTLTGGEKLGLALETAAEAAVSGEFCKWPRRASHLLMMYGFLLYVATTAILVYGYPTQPAPAPLPALWCLGAAMVLVGGLWFFLFLRVNVAHDGASPLSLGRADLFVGSLILGTAFALAWQAVQAAAPGAPAAWILFGLYIACTTFLFVSVPWSKFAHMFFKPAVAYQRRVEEADGSSDLPRPSVENFIVRS